MESLWAEKIKIQVFRLFGFGKESLLQKYLTVRTRKGIIYKDKYRYLQDDFKCILKSILNLLFEDRNVTSRNFRITLKTSFPFFKVIKKELALKFSQSEPQQAL